MKNELIKILLGFTHALVEEPLLFGATTAVHKITFLMYNKGKEQTEKKSKRYLGTRTEYSKIHMMLFFSAPLYTS